MTGDYVAAIIWFTLLYIELVSISRSLKNISDTLKEKK